MNPSVPLSNLHSEIELAVLFLAVDDVEAVRDRGLHIGDLEVEPLMMVVRIDVRIENQIVLVFTDLNRLYFFWL